MSEAELKELDELKKYYGTTITTRQALDALKEELRTQRERDPYWRFRQGHKFKTAWAEEWPGGMWISARVGDVNKRQICGRRCPRQSSRSSTS